MEKKSLGRGFEDISDIFLSDKNENKVPGGLSSTKTIDASRESKVEIVNDSVVDPKSNTHTFENHKDNERHIDRVHQSEAKHGKYFERDISGNSDDRFSGKKEPSENCKPEIDEQITVRKNIAYPNTPDAQRAILKSLSNYLEYNYKIKSIELRKNSKVSRPGRKNCVEEKITFFIKEDPPET